MIQNTEKMRNIENWKKTKMWHCPHCNAPVGSPECSCGLSFAIHSNGTTEIIFFSQEKPLDFTGRFVSVDPNQSKIFSVDDDGNIGERLTASQTFMACNITRSREWLGY